MPTVPPDLAQQKFASAPVGRLATADASGHPHVVVTTFAVEDGQIFTAIDHKPKTTRDLKRLRNIQENPQVSFLVDHYEDAWQNLWWVRADGEARILTANAEMARPIRMLANRYWQYRDNKPQGPVIAIAVQRWTGWSFTSIT
jgi:PPOX class probable F420-dependent enzyme